MMKEKEKPENGQMNEKVELPKAFTSTKALLMEGMRLGLKSLKHALRTGLLLVASNTILFFVALIVFFTSHASILCSLAYLLLLIGLGMFACWLVIQMEISIALIGIIRLLYKQMSPLFERLSAAIVAKSDYFLHRRSKVRATDVVDVKEVVDSTYGKSPGLLRRGISFIVNQIPIAAMLTNMGDALKNPNKEEATRLFHQQLDEYILNELLEDSTLVLDWILGINVALQILIIVLASCQALNDAFNLLFISVLHNLNITSGVYT